MRLTRHRVLVQWLVCVVCIRYPAAAQIILSDSDAAHASLIVPSSLQNLAPRSSDLAAHVDGTARLPLPHSFELAANPFESSADYNLYSTELRWYDGTFHPLDIDLELPSRGISWPIGRTFNARQSINGLHHTGHGPQGENWAQSSMPELLPTDNDRIILIAWGADRVSSYAQIAHASDSSTTVYRGVQGSAGTIEHVHTYPDYFRLTDPRGFQAVFFGEQSIAPRRLWYLADPAGRVAYVGSMQTQSAAAVSGYGADGLIDVAFDSAGRRYDYEYSVVPIGAARRLLGVRVNHHEVEVASVSYDYYLQDISGAGLAGDLKTVTVSLPLSDPAKRIAYRKHYRYWTEPHSTSHPGHPHAIRMVIEPEGFRRAVMEGLDPDIVVDSNALNPYASCSFEYDTERRISAFRLIELATSQTPGSVPIADQNTVSYESGIGPAALHRTIINASGHFTTLYFDQNGQQLSAIKTATHPGESTSWKVYEIARDEHGSVIYRGAPRAAIGYQHSNGSITRRVGGGLALRTVRVPSGMYQGFPSSSALFDGGSETSMQSEIGYVGQSNPSLALARNFGAGYSMYRPAISASTVFEDESGASPLTTTFAYRTFAEVSDQGSPLAIRSIDITNPTVTRDRNGSGISETTSWLFDPDGTQVAQRHEGGRIDAFEYDNQGQLTSFIRDCDTSRFTLPDDFQTRAGVAALHRITHFEFDPQGRLSAIEKPGMFPFESRRSEINVSALVDGRVVRFETPLVSDGRYYGPVKTSVVEHNGRIAAEFMLGFQGADYTLDASSTGVAPHQWITSGASGLDSIVGPPGCVRALLTTDITDATGTHLLRQDSYTSIPESLPGVEGVNYRSARHRYLRGVEVQTIDETGTINAKDIDAFGRVISFSRTTIQSGRPPLTLAQLTYDNGEPNGNDEVTGVLKYGGSSPNRTTTYGRDWRGRVVSVVHPASPHQLLSYDNLNRVKALGTYGGDGYVGTSSDPFEFHPKRRALSAFHRDQRGRTYKVSEYDIDQSTGSIVTTAGAPQSLDTKRWYSAAGDLVAWTGAMDGRRRYNALAEVTDEYVTVEPENLVVEAAVVEPPPDIIVTHRKFIRHGETGDVIAEVSAQRSAGVPVGMAWNPCASNQWPLIPPSLLSSMGEGSLNMCNDANSGGFSHPMQVESFVYDRMGRPIQRTRWGDPAYTRARGGEGCIPFGPRAAQIDGSTRQLIGAFPDLNDEQELSSFDDVYPRTETLARNRFGMPSVIAAPSGRATVIEYDDALRPVSFAKRLIDTGPMLGGSGDIAFSACHNPPPVRREYDGILLKAVVPGREQFDCEQARYENIYEPDPLVWAEYVSDVPDASAPSILSAKPVDNSDCVALSTDQWAVKRNAFGEIIKSRDPAGNVTDIDRDGAGRTIRLTITPASGGPAVIKDFVYDDLGRRIGATQNDDANGNTGSLRIYGLRGMILNNTDYIEPRDASDPLRGMSDSMTCYFNRVESRGWNREERYAAKYPGGITERYGSSSCEDNLDGLIGRTSQIDVVAAQLGCDPGNGPAFLRMNLPYHGIADPAWLDVQPDSSTGLEGVTNLRRVSMIATPDDLGQLPTNEFQEPKRDLTCAGIAGTCSTPQIDQELARDPDGKLLDLKDHIIEDSGRRVFYMDCTHSLDQFEGLFSRGYGESGGNFEDPNGARQREHVRFDDYGNVVEYQSSIAGVPDEEVESSVNGHNQVVQSPQFDHGPIEYDANGNLVLDGIGRRYEYDVENRLIRVFVEENGSERVFARYWYNAEGKRIAAAYNDTPDDDVHGDSAFENERIEHYAYDDVWRLRAVFVREANAENAIWRERYVYESAGLRGIPSSSTLDSPVAVQFNDDLDDDAERTSLILRNHMGDVIRLNHEDGTVTDIRYSLFGEPRSESFFADSNRDGAVDGDDVIVFFQRWDAGESVADVNDDGSVDGDDVITFFAWWDQSRGASDVAELRFGYRGYVRDPRLGFYHVRHRVYDPRPTATGMRWLQRDPAFFIDGFNLYAYCGGDPVNGVDPMGLQSEPPKSLEDDRDWLYWMWEGVKTTVWDWDPAGTRTLVQDCAERNRQLRQRSHFDWNDATELSKPFYEDQFVKLRSADFGQNVQMIAGAIDLATRLVFPVGDAVEGISEAGYRFRIEPSMSNAAAAVLLVVLEAAPGPNSVRLEMRKGETLENAIGRAVKCDPSGRISTARIMPETVLDGKRVWERPHLIEMERIDSETGKTNRQLMREGKAPQTPEGPINLHHIDQRVDSPLLWLTEAQHFKTKHPRSPSEIDRSEFSAFRDKYWRHYERTH